MKKKIVIESVSLYSFLMTMLLVGFIVGAILNCCGAYNYDCFEISLDSIIVVLLALMTSCFLNRRQVEFERNRTGVAKALLDGIYKATWNNVILLDNDDVFQTILLENDFTNPSLNKGIVRLEQQAFANEKYVIDMFSKGVLSEAILNDYFSMKEAYQMHMRCRIVYGNNESQCLSSRKDYIEKYSIGIEKIHKA